MNRGELSNEQWAKLAPLLAAQKPATGRPAKDHRLLINGMLWIARTGAPWRDLPERYGPWCTVASRFYRWRKAGLWAHVLARLQTHADALGEVDWQTHFVDGTVIRAHQHAAGAKKEGETHDEALGRSRGGFSTKLHLRTDGHGRPLTFLITPGQQHESTVFEPLMEQGPVKRAGRGRPRLRPHRLVGDKGYTGRRIRQYLRRHHIRITIARQRSERRRGPFDREAYRQRNRVERCINRLKQYRRIATRYEKRAANYLAMLTLVAIMLWL